MPSRTSGARKRQKQGKDRVELDGYPKNERQRILCESYVTHWNVEQAGEEAGYSPSYIKTHLYDVIKGLFPYISELQTAKEKGLALGPAPITQNVVSDAQKVIALANPDDYHESFEKDGKTFIRGKPWDKLTREQKYAIKEWYYDEDGHLRYVLHSQQQALNFLGRYLGMLSERLIIERRNVDIEAKFDFSGLPMKDLKKMEALLSRAKGITVDSTAEEV